MASCAPLHSGYESDAAEWMGEEKRYSGRDAEPVPRYVDRYGIEVTLGDVVNG